MIRFATYLFLISGIIADIDYQRFNKFAQHREESLSDINALKEDVFTMGVTRYTKLTSEDFPHFTTKNGTAWMMDKKSSWIVGFLPGIYWQLYAKTNTESYKNLAFMTQERFKFRQYDVTTHDVGLTMINSYFLTLQLNAYNSQIQKSDYEQILVNAAKSLASRFNWLVGCTRSLDNITGKTGFWVTMDNIMSLELLMVASQLPGGDAAWYNVAKSHADMTLKNHIREDGSSYHAVRYNENDGTVIDKTTFQGYAPNSTWARGQAW